MVFVIVVVVVRSLLLRYTFGVASELPRSSSTICSVSARYLSTTCPVVDWTYTGHILDIYCTTAAHLPSKNACKLLAKVWVERSKTMLVPAMSGEKSIGKGSEKSAICCRSGREMRDFCVIFVKKRVIVAEN